jgi:hypothetical protein
VTVSSGKRIYASDNQTLYLRTYNLTNSCSDSNCSLCSSDDTSVCVECVTLSQRPLLEGD